MMIPNNYDFILGKIQLYSYGINTNKYDEHLPLKISKNRPAGILPQIIEMFRNSKDFDEIINRFGIYFLK